MEDGFKKRKKSPCEESLSHNQRNGLLHGFHEWGSLTATKKKAALRYEDTVRLFNKVGMKYAIVVALVYTL